MSEESRCLEVERRRGHVTFKGLGASGKLIALCDLLESTFTTSIGVHRTNILAKHYKMTENSDYVTLVSQDGFSFVVQRSAACLSGAIKRMLDPACTSTRYEIESDELTDNI